MTAIASPHGSTPFFPPRLRRWLRAWCLAIVCCLAWGQPAAAREVMIRDIVVTNSSTDLLLFLRLVDAFSPEIIDGVQNGLAVTFNFEINLRLVRDGWPDKEVYNGQLDHTLSYDSLKKEYRMALSESTDGDMTTNSVEKAKTVMAELNGVRLLALDALQPDRQYVLKVRAILAKKTLPLYVHYLIPFSNFWNVNTDWYTVRFRF